MPAVPRVPGRPAVVQSAVAAAAAAAEEEEDYHSPEFLSGC